MNEKVFSESLLCSIKECRGIREGTFYQKLNKVLINSAYRIEYSGFNRIPEKGAAFLVSNHVSFLDGSIIAAACERPIRFVIEEGMYNVSFVKWCMDHYYKPVTISPKPSSVRQAIKEITEYISKGELVCIFPEGKHTLEGGVSVFKQGINIILKETPAPVYPVAIEGLWGSVFSKKYKGKIHRYVPKKFRRKISVVCYGQAIPPYEANADFLEHIVRNLKELLEN